MPVPKEAALPPDIVVFDIGNVLIEWDPRHLYRKLIPDAAAMERNVSRCSRSTRR